jgi:hypothetical protein
MRLHQWLRCSGSWCRRIGHGQGHRLQPQALGALTRYIDDGELPIDNNWVENQIRPIASGGRTGCSPAACAPAKRAAAS